ncbi:hypothetical protein BU25DRAFT_80429 [Macroventuria anomochaeta]|uniref:Uncharacterized protein n=1 Tax=Macroventuria anomochaeta TaxID=301207 RepID=A0ACB6SFC9_9PLEO|nr:uncharacterized protein BU25DRAFT_80429 [Macroventuria anomochaeta]KAF2632687.1 hypothetical protein BU25DRAFT_80429 [Macroventuria anomochaeta]
MVQLGGTRSYVKIVQNRVQQQAHRLQRLLHSILMSVGLSRACLYVLGAAILSWCCC